MTRLVSQTLMVENTIYVTVASCQFMADAFRAAFPDGKLTWAINDQAEAAAGKADVRAYIASQVAAHGDAVAFYGAMLGRNASDAANIAVVDQIMPSIASWSGDPNPQAMAWYIPAAVLTRMVEQHGVHTVLGKSDQFETDGLSDEGGVNVPYYPSKNHTLVPAQDMANATDVVVFETLSVALWESIRQRKTIHPIDARTLTRMQEITVDHLERFDTDFPFMTCCTEIDWVWRNIYNDPVTYQPPNHYWARDRLIAWWQWLAAEYDDLTMVTVGELGQAWRAKHPTGNDWAFTQSSTNPTNPAESVHWQYTSQRRIGITRGPLGTRLIDLVRYSDDIVEPNDAPTEVYSIPEPYTVVARKTAVFQQNPYLQASAREVASLLRADPELSDLLEPATIGHLYPGAATFPATRLYPGGPDADINLYPGPATYPGATTYPRAA